MTAYGIPAPRRLSLPRVKFKRPRWPKGDRFWLFLTILYALALVRDVAAGDWSLWGVPFDVALGWWCLHRWRLSRRDDDDGPSAT